MTVYIQGRVPRLLLSLFWGFSFVWAFVVIGILASIVIPSYHDFVVSAQASEGVEMTNSYKIDLAEYYAQTQDFTGFSSTDLQHTSTGKYVDSVSIDKASEKTIVLVATFKQTGLASSIQGKEYRTATEDGGITWSYGYGIHNSILMGDNHLQPKYLPAACR